MALKCLVRLKPTFVVEINEKCCQQELMEILIELKKMVADSNLTRICCVYFTSCFIAAGDNT